MIELSSPHQCMDIMQPKGVRGVIQEEFGCPCGLFGLVKKIIKRVGVESMGGEENCCFGGFYEREFDLLNTRLRRESITLKFVKNLAYCCVVVMYFSSVLKLLCSFESNSGLMCEVWEICVVD